MQPLHRQAGAEGLAMVRELFAKQLPLQSAEKVIHRIGFVGGVAAYFIFVWFKLSARPALVESLISQPLKQANLILILNLIGMIVVAWFLTALFARLFVNLIISAKSANFMK
jgi:hypothetical protein